MKRLLAVLSLALLVSLAVLVGGVGPAGAQQGKGSGGNDSASGWVRLSIFNTETFSAKGSELGTNASGHWKQMRDDAPDYLLAGEVRCLRVLNNTFEARGVITDARGGASTTFRGFILNGSDSGRFSGLPDTYRSFVTFEEQTEGSCVAPAPGLTVTEGEITVKDVN